MCVEIRARCRRKVVDNCCSHAVHFLVASHVLGSIFLLRICSRFYSPVTSSAGPNSKEGGGEEEEENVDDEKVVVKREPGDGPHSPFLE
jgi:hypothetical protein